MTKFCPRAPKGKVSQSVSRPVKDVPTQNMQGKEKKKGQEPKKSASLIGLCIALQIGKETGGEIRNHRECRNPDRQTERQTYQMAAT